MPEAASPTFEELVAEVARLRALIEERPPTSPAAAAPDRAPTPAVPVVGPMDRRAALRKAGIMAAGAVTGGAVLTAVTASPAAAATLTGSGNPGVTAQGLSGDGLSATTDSANRSAVYGTTAVKNAYGAFARNTGGGTAFQAESATTDFNKPTVQIVNTTGLDALTVQGMSSVIGVVGISGRKHPDPGTSWEAALSVETGVAGQTGVAIAGPGLAGGSVGLQTRSFRTGAQLQGVELGASVFGGRDTLGLGYAAGASPPVRADGGIDSAGMLTQHATGLWHCIESGAPGVPGSWRKLSGAGTAGAFHVLAAPARIYDSRPGTAPAVGSKTKLQPNVARTLDLKVNASTVPAGATAALLTILLVNATTGAGNATVWAQGVAKPLANTMVWGGNAGRFTATAVSALDAQARIQVAASLATDIVVDVVGFYR